MLLVKTVFVILAIFIGLILARKEYKKFSAEEKSQFEKELRHPFLFVFHILDDIGFAVFFIGIIFDMDALKYFAFLLISIGWIVEGARSREASQKSALLLILLGSVTFLITSFLALKAFGF